MFCAADAGGAMICLICRGVTIDSDLIMVRADSPAQHGFGGSFIDVCPPCFFSRLFMIQVILLESARKRTLHIEFR